MRLDRKELTQVELRCSGEPEDHDAALVWRRHDPVTGSAAQGTTPLLPSQTLVEADALRLQARDVEVAHDRREMPHDGAADASALMRGGGRHGIHVGCAQQGPQLAAVAGDLPPLRCPECQGKLITLITTVNS